MKITCKKSMFLKIYYTHHEMTGFTVHQKSQFSVQSISATIIRNKYYLGPLVDILWNWCFLNSGLIYNYVSSSNMAGNEISKDYNYFIEGIFHKISMRGLRYYLFLLIYNSSRNWMECAENWLDWWMMKSVISWHM